MIPVISFVAYSGTGKTTLLVRVIAELTRRGLRVGAIKHTHHELEFHQQGKDSARHAEAGAVLNVIAAPNGFSFTSAAEWPLAEILPLFKGVDLIIAEGYKQEPLPKIEVLRAEYSTERVREGDPHLVAVVSDFSYGGHLPHFGLDDVGPICDFIETRFVHDQ